MSWDNLNFTELDFRPFLNLLKVSDLSQPNIIHAYNMHGSNTNNWPHSGSFSNWWWNVKVKTHSLKETMWLKWCTVLHLKCTFLYSWPNSWNQQCDVTKCCMRALTWATCTFFYLQLYSSTALRRRRKYCPFCSPYFYQ